MRWGIEYAEAGSVKEWVVKRNVRIQAGRRNEVKADRVPWPTLKVPARVIGVSPTRPGDWRRGQLAIPGV